VAFEAPLFQNGAIFRKSKINFWSVVDHSMYVLCLVEFSSLYHYIGTLRFESIITRPCTVWFRWNLVY